MRCPGLDFVGMEWLSFVALLCDRNRAGEVRAQPQLEFLRLDTGEHFTPKDSFIVSDDPGGELCYP